MNRSHLFLRISYFGTLALALLGVTLRTVALLFCYDGVDPEKQAPLGYFQDGILPVLCYLCGILAVVLPIVCTLLIKADASRERTQDALAQPHPFACIPAVALLASSFLYTRYPLDNLEPIRVDKLWHSQLLTWAAILGCCAAVFFILRCSKVFGKIPAIVFSIAPVAWGILGVGYTYFSLLTTMNDATKLALQLGLVAAVLATTSEARALLGRYAPRSGLLFYSLAVFFCFDASIPTLISYFGGVRHPMLYVLLAISLLGVAIYNVFQLSRLFLIGMSEEEEQAEEEAPAEPEIDECKAESIEGASVEVEAEDTATGGDA